MTKVLFLDIDGPMIPRRAFYLPNQTLIVRKFDPVATALLNEVLAKTGAKLVISSTWGKQGIETVKTLLEENGISWESVHQDWVTPRKYPLARPEEIRLWLANHPEITHWASLDDEQLDLDGKNVKVTFDDGMLTQHYQQLLELLVVVEDDDAETARRIARRSTKTSNTAEHINRIIQNAEEK